MTVRWTKIETVSDRVHIQQIYTGYTLVSHLFTPGQPQPQDFTKLFKVSFELRLKQSERQVTDINHSRSQKLPLYTGNKKMVSFTFRLSNECIFQLRADIIGILQILM